MTSLQEQANAKYADQDAILRATNHDPCDDPWVGTKLPKRTNLTLLDEPLPLSDGVLKSLSEAARAMGKDSTARLVSDLLEKIVSDGLYKAVLDEEAA